MTDRRIVEGEARLNTSQLSEKVRAILFKPFFIVALVFCLGVFLTLLLNAFLRINNLREQAQRFQIDAELRADRIVDDLNNYLMDLDAIRRFYEGSEVVERHEFAQFVKPLFTMRSAAQALVWSPKIFMAARQAYEEEIAAQNRPGFFIHPALKSRSEPFIEAIFPVEFIEPLSGNETMAGLDLTSIPNWRRAMIRSCDSGLPIVSEPMDPLPYTTAAGFFIVMPVYRSEVIPTNAMDRQRLLMGFVTGLYPVGRIITEAISSGRFFGLTTDIFNRESGSEGKLIYRYTPPPEEGYALPRATSAAQKAMVYRRAFMFAGRQWQVHIQGTPSYWAQVNDRSAGLALILGLILTLLMTLYISALLTQRARAFRLVRERTQALHDSEDRQRMMFEMTRDAIFVVDVSTKAIIDANLQAQRLTGRSLDELKKMTIHDLHPPDMREWVDVEFKRIVNQPAWAGTETQVLHKEGRLIPVEIRNSEIILMGGQAIVIGVFRDITERIQSAKILQDLARGWQTTFDSVSDVIWLLDADNTIRQANRSTEAVLGRQPEEVMGKPCWEIVHGTKTMIKSCPIWRMQETLKREMQEVAVGDRWFEVVVDPILDEKRKLLGTVHLLRDITERKRIEMALRESELRYRRLHETMVDAFVRVDMNGRIVEFNKSYQQMLQYTPDELLQKSYGEIAPARWHALEMNIVSNQILVHGYSEVYEKEYRRKDGTIFPIELRTFLLRDEAGKPTGMWAIVRDISERKQAEETRRKLETQMLYAQKLESLGVMAGGVAHDFNNLLTAILGNIGLALSDLSPVSPVRENLEEAEKASRRAADLCKQMLAYSGKGRFEIHTLDVGHLILEMAEVLNATISKKAHLKVTLSQDRPMIEADPEQLRLVVMNLVLNASEAIGEGGGDIVISTGTVHCSGTDLIDDWINEPRPEGLYVYIEVADTGTGMDKTTLARIFDPFFTTKFTGRGLGLAAVQGVMRGHKGIIKVTSKPDHGTIFRVLFPLTHQQTGTVRLPSSSVEAWKGSGTVLLVDDEETVRSLGKKMLERTGFQVLTAADGREAVAIYQSHGADIILVLLDLTMPHMDGEETFLALRKLNPRVAVILSSGYNEQEITQRFKGTGLAGFMQKPYQLIDLRNKIRSVLEAANHA